MIKGIVRDLDSLGRATLPIEMRRSLDMVAGEPVDMWLEDEVLRIKLYERESTKGMVRRIDDLGRVTIPKEYRRVLDIAEGEGIDMFLSGQTICIEAARTKCVFCGSQESDKLIERNGKYACPSCIVAMRQEVMKG